jgi:hypothetical protein
MSLEKLRFSDIMMRAASLSMAFRSFFVRRTVMLCSESRP